MRPTTLFIIFAVAALALLAYLGKKAGIEPPTTDLELPEIRLPDFLTDKPQTDQTFYKWRDKDGNWHYSSAPPRGIDEREIVHIGSGQTLPDSPGMKQK